MQVFWGPITAPYCNISISNRGLLACKAASVASDGVLKYHHSDGENKKKVLVVGSGWAGLGAAYHLTNQGFDVTVLKDGDGLDGSFIQGFFYSYKNIFSLVDEVGIKPFNDWTRSAVYSSDGLEVEFPVFQNEPQLPAPFGTLFYTHFHRVPLVDRLASLPLMAAVIDFDNTDVAWRKYDPTSSRELLQRYGCSERLYRNVFSPLVQAALFAPVEQCSAAATLAMLNHMAIAHQNDCDMVWCRGTMKEKIYDPWMDLMNAKGCLFCNDKEVIDFCFDEKTGSISDVVCANDIYRADAIILALGISSVQELVAKRSLRTMRQPSV